MKSFALTSIFALTSAIVGIAAADIDTSDTCNKSQGSLSTNPTSELFPANFADPCIIQVGGSYYAFATNHNSPKGQSDTVNVPIASSDSFVRGWNFLVNNTDALPDPRSWTVQSSGGGAQVGAPDVNMINETHFVMYYSAKVKGVQENADRKCGGAAHATSVQGPYQPEDKPLACPSEGVVGPSGFQHNGKNYLLYKIGGHFNKTHTAHLHIRELTPDALNCAKGSQTVSLINNTAEEYDTKGPNMTVSPDGKTFFLWFVMGFFRDSDHAIRYTTGPSPTRPFPNDKAPYLLQTGETNGAFLLAPGGPDFVNATYMTFMATKPTATCGTGGEKNPETRHVHAAVLEYDGDSVKIATSQ